jgi:hypothetical protein
MSAASRGPEEGIFLYVTRSPTRLVGGWCTTVPVESHSADNCTTHGMWHYLMQALPNPGSHQDAHIDHHAPKFSATYLYLLVQQPFQHKQRWTGQLLPMSSACERQCAQPEFFPTEFRFSAQKISIGPVCSFERVKEPTVLLRPCTPRPNCQLGWARSHLSYCIPRRLWTVASEPTW